MTKPLMSVDSLQRLANALLVVATICGAATAVASYLSSKFSSKATVQAQHDALERVAIVNERAAKLEVDAAQARLQQEQLNEANAKLRIELEREKQRRLDLERAVASRRLSAEQHEALVGTLKRASGEIVIGHVSDPEASFFAEEIADAFRESGWTVKTSTWIALHCEGPAQLFRASSTNASTVELALKSAAIPFEDGGMMPSVETLSLCICSKARASFSGS